MNKYPEYQKIRDEDFDNLIISEESEESEDTGFDEPLAVLLFKPDMTDAEGDHWHICLDTKQAGDLRDWLTSFLARHTKIS